MNHRRSALVWTEFIVTLVLCPLFFGFHVPQPVYWSWFAGRAYYPYSPDPVFVWLVCIPPLIGFILALSLIVQRSRVLAGIGSGANLIYFCVAYLGAHNP